MFSIALSMLLLVGVDRIRQGNQVGFEGTLSQTDLVVGARGGRCHCCFTRCFTSAPQTTRSPRLLTSTLPTIRRCCGRFRFRWATATEDFVLSPRTTISTSITVIGAIIACNWREGVRAEGIFDAVLGSAVAAQLHYHLGQKIVLSHGLEGSFLEHTADPYTVVGILARTATPVDRAIYITLLGDEAMHLGWENGAPPLEPTPESQIHEADLHIRTISAFLLRTKSRIGTLFLQREINTYKPEPLTAIIPAVTLAGFVERAERRRHCLVAGERSGAGGGAAGHADGALYCAE